MNSISKNLFLYKFLASKCSDETYPPFDGAYLNYAYGKKFSPDEIKNAWARTAALIKNNKAPDQVGIYVHWPFCVSKCTYCFCDSFVPKSAAELPAYAGLIKAELDFFSGVFKGIRVHSVYLGGGTPTFISGEGLEDLLKFLKNKFFIDGGTQIYVEASPHTLSAGKLKIMAENGVNRITIGAQSLDNFVLKKINRIQTKKEFSAAFSNAKKLNKFKINVDLIAGLEGQTVKSFWNDLKFVIGKKPDMIHVYSFDPRPHTLFSRQGKKVFEKQKKERELMIKFAEKIINGSGYMSVKLADFDLDGDHVEDRQDTQWRKYNASVLGIGYNAVSHAFGSAWYQHPPVGVGSGGKINCGKLPPFTGVDSNEGEEMRKFIIHRLMSGFSRQEFKDLFGKDISANKEIFGRLKDLEKIGRIAVSKDFVRSFIESNEDYLVLSKHLYGKNMINNILKAHKAEYADCRKKYDDKTIDEYLKAVLAGAYKSMSFYKLKQ